MPTEVDNRPPYAYPSDMAYPVALAIFHHNNSGVDTPISGDLNHYPWQKLKERRRQELEHFPITWL